MKCYYCEGEKFVWDPITGGFFCKKCGALNFSDE